MGQVSLICPCGYGMMNKIGEDRSERLDIVPEQLRVVVTLRPKYACRTCTDGVAQAPAPSHLILGGLPTEATTAHVLVSKSKSIHPVAEHLKRSGKLFMDETAAPVLDPGAERPRPDISGHSPAMTAPGAARTRPA